MGKPSGVAAFVRTTTFFTILAAAAALGLYLIFPGELSLTTAITAGTICYHSNARGIIGAWIDRNVRPGLNPDHPWFREQKWEPPLYRLLRVRRWKDKMPTYTPQAFCLKETNLPDVICNSCSAELIHVLCMAAGFLPLVMVPFVGAFWVFFLTSLGAACADGIFVVIQRYNRPRLRRLYARQQARRINSSTGGCP